MQKLRKFNRRIKKIQRDERVKAALREVAGRRAQADKWPSLHHGMNRKIIVSLTSFAARFETLPKTLECLLFQTIVPDEFHLWLTAADAERLPDCVTNLQQFGLQLRICRDLRSYKKIVPALIEEPNAIIVTADDDVYYWPTWLSELLTAYSRSRNPVIAHRANRITLELTGLPQSYKNWIRPWRRPGAGALVFPIGVHGVLFDARAFHADVTRDDLFSHLCPESDDVWLYWMHRLSGSRPLTLGLNRPVIEWPSSQAVSLQTNNIQNGGNDQAILRMINEYGFPH